MYVHVKYLILTLIHINFVACQRHIIKENYPCLQLDGNNTKLIWTSVPCSKLPASPRMCVIHGDNADNAKDPYYMADVARYHFDLKTQYPHFDLHFALKSDDISGIVLNQWKPFADNNYTIFIGDETRLRVGSKDIKKQKTHHFDTPNLVSMTQYRVFYVKVDDDKLQFGKEGDRTPIISYSDASIRLLDNYKILLPNAQTEFWFCPPPVTGNIILTISLC